MAAFYWLTPFAGSFVNSDRLGLVIHSYEQDGAQKLAWSTF